MESPSPIEIISIDVPDTVLRKNIQNATNVACVASRHVGSGGGVGSVGVGGGLEEAREKFISALLAENGNAKHITTAKAAYPGLAKQIIATETGESQILDEVGFVDDDRKVRKVVRVQPRSSQLEEVSPGVATSSKRETSVVKSSEASSRLRVVDVGLGGGRIKDREARSSISSSTVSSLTISARDNGGGRHEGALSDFSVDKEDYRLTRYGLDDDTVEDEVQDERNDSRLDEQRLSDSIESQQESLLYKTQHTDRTGSDEVHDQDGFPSDSVRCSNTQVLVLVSAMIHNPFDKEGATLIVEENGVQGKGEIMIYKGESDGSIDKLSLLVQSPVPSSVSDESTVKIQEIVDDGTEIVRGDSDDSLAIDDKSSKRDVSLEIDGKYVKSVVNARKSPRKTKNGQMRVYGETDDRKVQESETMEKSVDSGTQSEETFYKTVSKSSKAASSRSKSPRKESKSRSNGQRATSSSRSKIHESTISDERTRKVKRYDAPLKGSLDSVINANDSRTVSRRRSKTEEMFSKKSKSYESIKKMPEVCYEDPSKADSTSQLITANELDMQTDEFCSACCYVNEFSLKTEEVIGTEEAILRSNCSSIVDEDSTECDICSSWNLQESTDTLDRKLVSSATDCDQLCEVCEICNEICATFNPDQEPRSYSVREPRAFDFSSRSLPKDSSRIGDSIATDPSLDEDSFEIENCGFQSGPESMDDRKLGDQTIDKQLSLSFNISDSAVIKKKSRDKYFIPKDELAILASGGKRMNRKGSLFRKKPAEDSVNVSQDKRRYSSVDNLQLAKASSRGNEKVLRSKNSKVIGSADNIRSSRSSRRCKSLQRSADNVRHMDSSTDNLDSLVESLGREDETSDHMNWMEQPKVRDNETVKMILTKHGIKIISEKETAL
ncbi:hypothetical protein K0M31_001506 [Melipona bicolor]|uniref:Uncharacterized protein n=1 Tax=Melipona bicolor TaxID=60889 RepID=A0AA40GFN2_9HYME|nr:hypothetical protein K0M31_001506 [Melipona bicolor]